MDWIDLLIRDLCEIPDRNSPDDQPEMLVVTASEIRAVIEIRCPRLANEEPPSVELTSGPCGPQRI